MIGTIRKHQQWLWAIIITATIISFVIWTGNRGNRGPDYGSMDLGSVNGEKVTREDFERARAEVLLQYLFNTGNPYKDDAKREAEFQQRIYVRLLLMQKLEQHGIRVSSEKAGQIANLWIQRFGRGDRQIGMEEFRKALLEPQHLTVEDLDRFARHEIGIQELAATIGTAGALVTPQEAQELYKREHQEIATQAVFFSLSNYLNSITVTPEALGQFYTNQMAIYRLPERRQVTYVRFPYTNYLAKVAKDMTNLNEKVEAAYKQFGTNAIQDAKTPEEAKAKIKEEMVRLAESIPARDDANQFARPLFEGTNTPSLADFAKLAQSSGVQTGVSEPFAHGEIPKGLDVGLDFSKAAFNLDPTDQPFSQPIRGKDGVYILAYNKVLPSEIPPLEQIKDKVTMDYKMGQAAMQARRSGMEFSQTVSNGMAQGKTFEAIAAEAKVKPVQLPPVSLSTKEITNLDNVPLDTFREVAFSTQPGKVSPFRPTREGGFLVYVKSALPIDEARMKAELPQFTAFVRQARESEAFQSWFRKEIERAHIDAPFIRQQQEEMRKAGRA
jgi:parvulin-like peptidyl-prolyl isomerase